MAQTIYNGNSVAYFIEAYCHNELGNNEKSLVAYRKVLSINGKDYGAYYNMGLILLNMGRYSEALESFNSSVQIIKMYSKEISKENILKIYNNIGKELIALEIFEEAIKYLKSSPKKNSETYYLLGQAYDDLRQYIYSHYYYKRAEILDHNYAIPQNMERTRALKLFRQKCVSYGLKASILILVIISVNSFISKMAAEKEYRQANNYSEVSQAYSETNEEDKEASNESEYEEIKKSASNESKRVPNITGLNIIDAETELNYYTFEVGEKIYVNNDALKGTVLGQVPRGGKMIEEGTTVDLIVSKGSEENVFSQDENISNNRASTLDTKKYADNRSISIEGLWNAVGRDDGVQSTWNFNNGTLIVNGQYRHTYSISELKDRNGYTVVTIFNPNGTSHVLLLKEATNGNGMNGLTAEGNDYRVYLKDQTPPVNNQVIEFYR